VKKVLESLSSFWYSFCVYLICPNKTSLGWRTSRGSRAKSKPLVLNLFSFVFFKDTPPVVRKFDEIRVSAVSWITLTFFRPVKGLTDCWWSIVELSSRGSIRILLMIYAFFYWIFYIDFGVLDKELRTSLSLCTAEEMYFSI
jgi:hypothetical protein